MQRLLRMSVIAAVLLFAGQVRAAQLFSEDFSDNFAGWSLEAGWQIGAARTSSRHQIGFPDPALDSTPGADNGIAGVNIGGNIPFVTDFFRYLTSPAIDAAVEGSVFLEYQRWLNTDRVPFFWHQIEVNDGASWQVLWTSPPIFITDSSWLLQRFDLTPYKNENLRVRFGYRFGQVGAFTVSGWNIDDVVIEAPSVAAIPEPESYALLVAGLALLGFAVRRRR